MALRKSTRRDIRRHRHEEKKRLLRELKRLGAKLPEGGYVMLDIKDLGGFPSWCKTCKSNGVTESKCSECKARLYQPSNYKKSQ